MLFTSLYLHMEESEILLYITGHKSIISHRKKLIRGKKYQINLVSNKTEKADELLK